MARFVWKETTRNCHSLLLDGEYVASVVRPQKHQSDGTKHDWRIEVLGTRSWAGPNPFRYDVRNLESMKACAELETRQTIARLYAALPKGGA